MGAICVFRIFQLRSCKGAKKPQVAGGKWKVEGARGEEEGRVKREWILEELKGGR